MTIGMNKQADCLSVQLAISVAICAMYLMKTLVDFCGILGPSVLFCYFSFCLFSVKCYFHSVSLFFGSILYANDATLGTRVCQTPKTKNKNVLSVKYFTWNYNKPNRGLPGAKLRNKL